MFVQCTVLVLVTVSRRHSPLASKFAAAYVRKRAQFGYRLQSAERWCGAFYVAALAGSPSFVAVM